MQYTPHFNLNLPEGTDVVNPLVQDNPNYTAIDAAMFANKQAVIGSATELVSGTAHAITRANTDSDYFRFTATGNWTAGDTVTVDGNPVSVYLTDGTTPATGAYVINSEVLGMLAGSRLTLIVSGKTTSIAGSGVTVDPTGTDLVSTNAQDAIVELSGYKTVISVPSNSAETYGDGIALVAAAYAALSDDEKIGAIIKCSGLFQNFNVNGTFVSFSTSTSALACQVMRLSGSYYNWRLGSDNTISMTDYTALSRDHSITLYVKK